MSNRIEATQRTASFLEARSALLKGTDLKGAARRVAYGELVDQWLRELFELANSQGDCLALAAVGALGRHELAPGSDLDLVLLSTHKDTKGTAAIADALWYPIWDSPLALDHSVRTPAQATEIARTDIKAAIGLLDLRHIAGNADLTAGVKENVLAYWRQSAIKVLPELKQLGVRRCEQFGEVASLLEPDLKESYGGIREATVLRAIAASWISDIPRGSFELAHQQLLDVRDELHLVTARSSDRLVLQEQEAIAQTLGLASADDLLRSVCAAGRTIAYALDVAWYRVDQEVQARADKKFFGSKKEPVRTPLANGVVEVNGEVVLARDADLSDAVLGLRAGAAAAQGDFRLAPATVERIAAASPDLGVPWSRAAREEFVSLLGAGPAALAVWEAFDQAGLWSNWIDGWERLRALPQHNPVHRFTVDRHLVEAALQAAALTRRVHRPDLLLVGAFLHDVGKGLPGDHTQRGMELIKTMAPAMGFDHDDTDVLVDLCRHHLLLPDTATRRDLEDPATVAGVISALGDSAIGSAQMLDLVAALTEADAKATGPAAWSDWRAGLIEELVQRTHQGLRGEVSEREPELTTAELDLMERDWGSAGVSVEVTERNSIWRVIVVAQDRPGLMADVAGVLSMNRLAVRAASLRTDDHRALQIWTVQPTYGDPPGAERLREDLVRVFENRLDLPARLKQREEAYSNSTTSFASPVVEVISGASQRANVLEVRAHDGPALLHRIGLAIANAGVTVQSAQVSTMGSEAVDVFYITNAQGKTLPQAELDVVAATVQAALI